MNVFRSIEHKKLLKKHQLVLCQCPDWNEEGFQVAIWNGLEFEYSTQSNSMFNDCITAFIPLEFLIKKN